VLSFAQITSWSVLGKICTWIWIFYAQGTSCNTVYSIWVTVCLLQKTSTHFYVTNENLMDVIRISGIKLTSMFSLVVKVWNSTVVIKRWIEGSDFSFAVFLPIHYISIMTAKPSMSFTNLFLIFINYSLILICNSERKCINENYISSWPYTIFPKWVKTPDT